MSEGLVISDINGVCRLCLKGDGTIIPIFGRETTSRDCIPLSKKILDCVSIKVFDGDGLPHMICVGCVHQVDSWHGFKNACDSSQEKLMGWLQKTRPDIYSKYDEYRRRTKTNTIPLNAQSSAVIDLSSGDDDDDDVIITHQPVLRRALGGGSGRRVGNRPSNHSQIVEVISLGTNEVEIFPVDDDVCLNEKEISQELTGNIPTTSTAEGLPDVVTGLNITKKNTDFSNGPYPTDDPILSDSDASEVLNSSIHTTLDDEYTRVEVLTKDSQPKETDTTNGPLLSQTSNCESLNENMIIEQVQISPSEFNEDSENETSESQEHNSLAKHNTEPFSSDQESMIGQETSNLLQSDGLDEPMQVQQIYTLDKNSSDTVKSVEKNNSLMFDDNYCSGDKLVTDDNSFSTDRLVTDDNSFSTDRLVTDDNSTNVERLTSFDNSINADTVVSKTSFASDKPDEESIEISNELGPSLVIERVTSLTNECEQMIEDVNSREHDDGVNHDNTWGRISQDEDSGDVQPDIVMCDTSMVVNVKEEPASAGETTGDEEDPLNFQGFTIKREPEDWIVSEPEDVKPNIQLLNEVIEYQYTPKKLKNGKIHCEPCRVSFVTDLNYDRHGMSLRHRLNLKLFKSGKGPTRKRGKTLVRAILGNNYDFTRSKGPYFCNYCPSGFKHLRNLHTHKKKHLTALEYSPQMNLAPQESSDLGPFRPAEIKSSKPPQRQSAQNVKFINCDETKCDLCNQTFATFSALVSHKRYCGVSENRVCIWCHQNFTTTSLYFRHRKECLKLYRKQRLNMTQQVQVKNIPPPAPPLVPLDGTVLACTLCNLTFQSSPDLISHMQQNHMDFGRPQSPIELPNFTKPNNFSRSNNSQFHYCKYCSRSFTTHGALTSHTGYHARKNVYCCKFCKQTFRDKISFRQHMKVHIGNPNLNTNVCWICYTPFSSPKDLIDHKNIHANIKMKIFSCSICGNSYNTRELLSRHRKSAHGAGQSLAMFNHEQSESVSDVMLKEPKVQYIEEDNKLFKCRICKKRFTTLGNLKRHTIIHKNPLVMGNLGVLSVEHSSQNRCGWCFKTFKTQSGLLNHRPVCTRVKKTMTNVNHMIAANSGKPIKCKGCKKWFASQNSLHKHKVLKRCRAQMPSVSTDNPMISQIRSQNCPNCDQQFLSEESLNRHKQNCKPTIDRLTCDCGEVFSSVEQKLAHSSCCPANCTCKTCTLKFNSPEELASHQSICQIQPKPPPTQSTGQLAFATENRLPPAECFKCKKKFVYSKCLKVHQEKCFSDRWPCVNCMKIFPTEATLATHKSHKTCYSPRLNRSPSTTSINENPTFKCDHCPMRFISGNELKQHSFVCENRLTMKQGDVESGDHPPFSCDLCDKTFLWKANVQRHKRICHKLELSKKSEQVFNKTGISVKDESPGRTIPEKETSFFKCKKCPDIVFHKRQGFLEHQLVHERQEGTNIDGTEEARTVGNVMLTCELCDKKLPEALYPMHMDEHMNDDFEESQTNKEETLPPKYACDICGKEFDTFTSRKSHRATHYRAGDVLAHLSPKKSPKKKKMKVKHVRCATCNKLLSVNSIAKHKMMHVREAAEFYGENQNASTINLNKVTPALQTPRSATPSIIHEMSLNLEEIEEESTAVFPCPKCDKSFKLRKLLLEHFKGGHHDESFETESTSSSNTGTMDQYPYKCVYCDLSWKHKSVYERHLTSKKHFEIQKQLSGII